MSITATILLLISAFTHAGWNYISKKEHPSQAFFLVSNTIGVICVFPILLNFRHHIPLVPSAVFQRWRFEYAVDDDKNIINTALADIAVEIEH